MEGVMVFQFKCQHLCLRKRAPFPRISPANPNCLSKFTGGKSYVLTRWRRYQILPAVKAAAAAASSSSPSIGGGGDYPEQLVDYRMKKKQRVPSVAGVCQDELVDPRELADPDSCFCEFKGVDVHYKLSEQGRAADHNDTPASSIANSILNEQALPDELQNQKIGLPMILLHGFGASVFSWNRVRKPLADIIGSTVLAFDRPAFGLTSRVCYSSRPAAQQVQDINDDLKHSINPYSMIFSVLATLYFIDFRAPSQKKTLLVGHSAGALVAVNAYFEAPERFAALILVDPAIWAPLFPPKVAAQGNQSGRNENIQEQESTSDSNHQSNLFIRLGQILSKVYLFIATTITRMLKGMLDVANALCRKAVSAILRCASAVVLVRWIVDKFGIPALRNAWYDAKKVSDHVIHGYTKPLRAKCWDWALIEYTQAMLTDFAAPSNPSLTERLHEIKCPVLIISGDTDRFLPSCNAKRLSRAIPGSHFELVKNCGHLPQEEKPEEFISVVQRFLQSTFSSSNDLCLQAST